MRIAIAADHGGFALKEELRPFLESLGHKILDLGTENERAVNYPDYAEKLCLALKNGEAERGILVCGTGIGMSMVANRYRHIRAALCYDAFGARLSREHNDANVLCLGGRVLGVELARDIVTIWLETPFAGGRHQMRIDLFC